ncbi:hypothetical protein [Lactococcus lactis]|uniref:hypothetical protein n=1 Tax=Lactococcus lactis TaxID=1358 RepID=UPI0015C39483|nr:hypothetical protein [Lactococcus lactis]MCT0076707.1 hypothetical protein [Lactococcus lactis subsp. lactis]QLF89387.1 hypothetical protein HPC60_01070 [Lactococcus lactis subsp. lactis]
MAKFKFQFSNQVNFESEDFSNVDKLLTFLEDENERLKAQGQSASFSLQKLDKKDQVIANFERIDLPIDVWDEHLFSPLYEHNIKYLKNNPDLASIIISEKPQIDAGISLSEDDNNWEKQLLEASEKELLERQSDEQSEDEEKLFTYSPTEEEKVPATEVVGTTNIVDDNDVPPFIYPTENKDETPAESQSVSTATEPKFIHKSQDYAGVVESMSAPISIASPSLSDHLNILENMGNSDDQELNQLLTEISTYLDQKLTSYTSKMEQSTNQELESIDRREGVKKALLDQCSQLTQSQIHSLNEQLTQEKARAISDEQTRHQNELSRIEVDFNSRLMQGKQDIEMTNLSNAQKEIEKRQSEITSTLSTYAKTKAEQNQGKLHLMKSKLQDTFSSIFKKNIIKEEGYRDDILSKFSGGSDSSLPDESLKIKPLHVSQDLPEKSPHKNILVR